MREMGNIIAISKKEFMDNWRNKWIIALSAIFLILMLVTSYFGTSYMGGKAGWRSLSDTIYIMSTFVLLLIPIIALILGYASIVGEKEKGSLALLLSYPVSREEVVIGKFLGLSMVIIIAIILGFGLAGIIIGINTGEMNLGIYAIFILSSILIGISYLSIALLVSSLFEKRSTAMGAVIFLWFFFAIIFSIIVSGAMGSSLSNVVKNVYTSGVYENGERLFSVDGVAYSIAYGDKNIFLAEQNAVYKYNLITGMISKIKIPSDIFGNIAYCNRRLFATGDKTLYYDFEKKRWGEINISSNDIACRNGEIYLMNFSTIIEYNISNGERKSMDVPFSPYSIVYGDTIYFSYGRRIYRYDSGNETWIEFANLSETIRDMAYGDGKIFALATRIYEINVSDSMIREIMPSSSKSIAYGDGKIFSLSVSSKYMVVYPDLYYAISFLNPNEIYQGIIRVNLNGTFFGIKIKFPSFYNTPSLMLSLVAWTLAPLIASIYIFKRKDI